MSSISKVLEILKRRGPGYGIYLATGYLWPDWKFRLLSRLSPRRRRFVRSSGLALLGVGSALLLLPWIGASGALGAAVAAGLLLAPTPALGRRLRHGRRLRRARETLRPGARRRAGGSCPSWQDWPVDPAVREAVEAARNGSGTAELGRIDADGRLSSPFGTLPGFDPIDSEGFLRRRRYDLDLLLTADGLAVRKDYRGDRRALEREWLALSHLEDHANVPAVLAVDEAACRLTRTFLAGETVNDLLVAQGARLRLAQTRDDPELARLDEAARLAAVLARGTERLGDCLGAEFPGRLEQQVDAIHRRGVTGFSLTFGNVMVSPEGEVPWLFDFDNATVHAAPAGIEFALERDRDRRLLARLYSLDLVTEASARRSLASDFPSSYAPVDLGRGIASRGFWSVDSGTGRWEFLNGPALGELVPGKRILDLGSHNCVLPLLMLRAGARQVVAVERSAEVAASARRLQKLFEWRDLTAYDLDLRRTDMRSFLDADWGSFDIVSAFCSLYYLEEEEMAQVVRRAAELAPVMVLQAKSDTRPKAAANKAEKSAPEFLGRLLAENGFPHIRTIAPAGYSRPLLIGRVAEAHPGSEP